MGLKSVLRNERLQEPQGQMANTLKMVGRSERYFGGIAE